jgi:hypothetical protein
VLAGQALNRIALDEREIEDFERLVYGRRQEPAAKQLLVILNRVYRIYRTPGRLVPPDVERSLYTRLAAAVGALFADPDFKLSETGFSSFALHHSTLGYLFAASALGGADHIAALLGTRTAGHPQKLHYQSQELLSKLLLVWSLDSNLELDLEGILRSDPQRFLPLYLGMLNRYLFLTPAAHRRREALLRMGELFSDATLGVQYLPALAVAWMNCMYATQRSKHAVKRPLNQLVNGLAGHRETLAARQRRSLPERPLMLVPVEEMRVGHVNYRSYGPLLRQLREHFTLVAAGTSAELDEGSSGLFDRVVDATLPADARAYPELISRLLDVKADIVYYPTVGMNPWCIVSATQRLAPIQITTMGVPATTYLDAMDYVLIEESWAGDAECYTETLIHTRRGSTRFLLRDWDSGARSRGLTQPRPSDGAVRLAVPALAPKLNAPFLETCARIAASSRVALEWHFFGGLSGLQHAVAERQIQRFIPTARVYGYLAYDSYMNALADCDLHLSTFPFGGTNTNLDSMQLGIPMITLEGREAHSQIDAGMIRRAGLPEWLIAHSMDEYVEVACRFIHDAQLRHDVRRKLLNTNLEEAFLSDGAATAGDFTQAFLWIYENHEAIQRAARKCWTVSDREGFGR